MKRIVLGLCLGCFLAGGAANAGVIPSLDMSSSGVDCQPGAGGAITCTYNYVATLNGNAELTSTTADHAEYFTIYDFRGYIPNTVFSLDARFAASTPLVSPALYDGAVVFDDPAVRNLTFTYVGGDLNGPQTFTGFGARSTYGPAVVEGRFSSAATRFTRSSGSTWVQTTGFVDVPDGSQPPGDAVPEPMTVGLTGSGLLLVGLLRRR